MGLVKISEAMHAQLRLASQAFSRSINAQAEHWMRVGMLAELHPTLTYPELCRLLLAAEASGVSPFEQAAGQAGSAQGEDDAGKAAA